MFNPFQASPIIINKNRRNKIRLKRKFSFIKSFLLIIIIVINFLFSPPLANSKPTERKKTPKTTSAKKLNANRQIKINCLSDTARSWEHLRAKLSADGISNELLDMTYCDSRMPLFEEVHFSLKPKEAPSIYSGFLHKKEIQKIREQMRLHKTLLDEVAQKYKVNKYILSALLYVESRFGTALGKELVVNRLSRVAGINQENNLRWVFSEYQKRKEPATIAELEARAKYLETTFYPELLALFQLATEKKIEIFELYGSKAGAFGIPQFMPLTAQKYGVDFNQNGKISLFELADGIASAANYLRALGWKDDLARDKKNEVLLKYNNSLPYATTLTRLENLLKIPSIPISETKTRNGSNIANKKKTEKNRKKKLNVN
ncbi:MAG TPA: lytic murein transglycosylase [Oligoflexia bacterium]|nr:lytic murein transglycosylase [Oligoflexia bacterium]HMP26810.1 lytic murein transglycosylase [Oligoflexia bacterium]